MAGRKAASTGLTAFERFGGTIFFVVYLLLLPVAAGPLFDWAQALWGQRIGANLRGAVYYYGLVAVTVLIFHSLLARTTRRLTEAPAEAGKTDESAGRPVPGSVSFVPPAAGLRLAGYVLMQLLEGEENGNKIL